MKRFVLQMTPEGEPESIRIVEADEFIINGAGGINFLIDGVVMASFSEFAIVCAEDFWDNITLPLEEE